MGPVLCSFVLIFVFMPVCERRYLHIYLYVHATTYVAALGSPDFAAILGT